MESQIDHFKLNMDLIESQTHKVSSLVLQASKKSDLAIQKSSQASQNLFNLVEDLDILMVFGDLIEEKV